jgi:hypothetical protein
VIVDGQDKLTSALEWIRVSSEPQSVRCIGGEDDLVLIRRRSEKVKHCRACPLHKLFGGAGSRVYRIGIPKGIVEQHPGGLVNSGRCAQAAAREV